MAKIIRSEKIILKLKMNHWIGMLGSSLGNGSCLASGSQGAGEGATFDWTVSGKTQQSRFGKEGAVRMEASLVPREARQSVSGETVASRSEAQGTG